MIASPPIRPAAGSFEATVAWHGRIAVVTMEGALDFYSAREGRHVLLDVLEHDPSRLLVEVDNAFVDSSGIAILVHVAQRARQERRDFRLRCRESLAGILRLNGLEELLGVGAASTPARPDQESVRRPLAA